MISSLMSKWNRRNQWNPNRIVRSLTQLMIVTPYIKFYTSEENPAQLCREIEIDDLALMATFKSAFPHHLFVGDVDLPYTTVCTALLACSFSFNGAYVVKGTKKVDISGPGASLTGT